MRTRYAIRRVDADEYAPDIARLQTETNLIRAPDPDVAWWFAFFYEHPIAYLGITPSREIAKAAYLIRVGVLTAHRGNGLQLRLMRVAERYAKRGGYRQIVSDTLDNPPSANNFIRSGYEIFAPAHRWATAGSTYWRKNLWRS